MTPIAKTAVFVAVAAISVATAYYVVSSTAPEDVTGYEKVSEPFYPEFDDPNAADSLVVSAFDEDTATASSFSVVNKDGDFVIPTHHDYPAEAGEQLAKTTASVIGIERGALKGRRKKQHEEFGVIDPRDAADTALKGRGKRITLMSGGLKGETLVDLIVGNAVPDQPGTFYVRRPDEDEVYAARISVDVSTKFSDWIEPDLLKLDRDNVERVVINEYQVDTERGRMTPPKLSTLERPKFSEPWILQEGNDESFQVNEKLIDDLAQNIDDLKIVGVRPKPEGLRPNLTVDPKLGQNPAALIALQNSLLSKGFFITEFSTGGRQLVSTEGELMAGTNQGALYHLYFGNLFTGSTKEIEIGGDDAESGDGKDDESESEDEEIEDDASLSRYMFVRVEFDPTLLGPKPEPPVKPTPPAGYDENGEKIEGAATEKTETGKPDTEKSGTEKSGTESSEDADKTESGEDAGAAAKKDDAETDESPVAGNTEPDDESECGGQPPEENTAADEPAKKADEGASTEGSAKDEPASETQSKETQPESAKADEDDGKEDDGKGEEAAESAAVSGDEKVETADEPQGAGDENAPETKDGADAGKGDEAGAPQVGETAQPPVEKPDPVTEYRIARNQYEAALVTYQNDLADYERRVKEGQEKVDELNKRFERWFYVISAKSFKDLKLSRNEILEPKMEEPAPGGPAGAGAGGPLGPITPGGGLPRPNLPGPGND